MSKETLPELNTNTLIGFTDRRGHAWHYRANLQGTESNHYAGAIPVEDVARRLFGWKAAERRVLMELPATLDDMHALNEYGQPVKYVVTDRKAIAADDNNHLFEIFKGGYVGHDYNEWLLQHVANILDDNLSISSAGLLKSRAVAWVEVSVPDNIKTPEGVEFRPNLLACTSFDGSLATTYKRTIQLTVCDNTMAVALRENGQTFKVKHSKYSQGRIMDARDALGVVFDVGEAFSAEVARLTQIELNDNQFNKVLDVLVPVVEEEGRKRTLALNKRDQLHAMYAADARTRDWKGTAFGVLQTFNTYNHHESQLRDTSGKGRTDREMRSERNMLSAIDGSTEKSDGLVLDAINKVLQLA